MIDTERPADQRRPPLEPWRCPKCHRILAKVTLAPNSEVEIKCGSCNTYSSRVVG